MDSSVPYSRGPTAGERRSRREWQRFEISVLFSMPPVSHALQNGVGKRFLVTLIDESDFRRERLRRFTCSGKEYQLNIRAYRFDDPYEFVPRELHALIGDNAADVPRDDLLHCRFGVASCNDS